MLVKAGSRIVAALVPLYSLDVVKNTLQARIVQSICQNLPTCCNR